MFVRARILDWIGHKWAKWFLRVWHWGYGRAGAWQ